MAGRPDVGSAGSDCRETYGVVDCPDSDFIVTDQTGENGQPSRIGRGPPIRAQGVGAQIVDSPRAGLPGAIRLGVGAPGLVQLAMIAVHDQDMPVAAALRSTFDGYIQRDGVGTGVAFVGVLKADRHHWLGPRDEGEGDADRTAVPQPRAEIGMQVGVGANAVNVVC